MKRQIATFLLFLFMALQLPAIATVIVNDANPKDCGIRCTLVSGHPVADGSSAGNGTIDGDPVDGGRISFNDGEGHWRSYTLSSEIGYALSGCTAGNMYDLYIYYNTSTGLIQFDTPVQWSSPTTMPTRTVVDGVSLNPANITRRLACSFYCIGTNLTIDNPIARCVSNQQNRQDRTVSCFVNTNYTYAGGFRASHAATNVFASVGAQYFWCASSDGTNTISLIENDTVDVSEGTTSDIGLGFSGATGSFPGLFAINGNNETVSLTAPFATQLPAGFNSINAYETTNGTTIFGNLYILGTVKN
jgi:hypothetical protein